MEVYYMVTARNKADSPDLHQSLDVLYCARPRTVGAVSAGCRGGVCSLSRGSRWHGSFEAFSLRGGFCARHVVQ